MNERGKTYFSSRWLLAPTWLFLPPPVAAAGLQPSKTGNCFREQASASFCRDMTRTKIPPSPLSQPRPLRGTACFGGAVRARAPLPSGALVAVVVVAGGDAARAVP